MRFGVLSTANIARAVVIPAIRAAGHEVLAVASRDPDRARTVADDLAIERHYGDYEALLADPDVEAVYNPLPNALHAEWTIRAAEHGLPVLCEKPLAGDAATAREMVAACADAGVTLMEAYMWRYHPRTERAEALAAELGTPRRLEAAFHFPMDDPTDVRLDPELAGGALRDVGCYPVTAARALLGDPERVHARTLDSYDAGVDTTVTAHLEYADGAVAHLAGSFETDWVQRYRLEGTDGWLAVEDGAFTARGEDPDELRAHVDGRTVTERWTGVDQYAREVTAFVDAVREDTPLRTGPQEAVRNMELLDAIAASARSGAPVEL